MTMDEKTLLEAKRFRVVEIMEQTRDNRMSPRQLIRHSGAVVIVPMVDDDYVCLIRNYRIAVDETLIELPAGTLEPNEDPRASALRELTEETGFKTDQIKPLNEFYLSPGILDERMHLFVATDLVEGQPNREPGEHIENLIVSWSEAMKMVEERKIHDAKTLVGLLSYDQIRSRNSKPNRS